MCMRIIHGTCALMSALLASCGLNLTSPDVDVGLHLNVSSYHGANDRREKRLLDEGQRPVPGIDPSIEGASKRRFSTHSSVLRGTRKAKSGSAGVSMPDRPVAYCIPRLLEKERVKPC